MIYLQGGPKKPLSSIVIKSHYKPSLRENFYKVRLQNEKKNVKVCIKYSMCDLICDIITCWVWSCDTGKINASDKIMFENQKKKTNMEIKDIFT